MLKKNEEILKKRYSNFIEKVELCKTDKDLRYQGGRLFYKDIELDGDVNIKDNVRSIDTIILHGFGRANTLRKLRDKFKKTLIVVLEFNPCVFREVLRETDLSELLSDNKIFVLKLDSSNFKDSLSSLFILLEKRIMWGYVYQYVVPGYEDVDFYDVVSVKNEINKQLSPIFLNRNTLLEKSTQISENIVKNIESFVRGEYVEKLRGIFENSPALVVASGPSLSRNIETLKEIKDRALVIAVDSVLSFLEQHDVEPDIVCGVDYQYVNLEKYVSVLKKKRMSGIAFAHTDGVFHQIPKLFRSVIVDYTNMSFAWLYRDIIGKFSIKRFGINAVTHLAIQLAYIVGANPIIFVGQDWAYSGGLDHAKGASVSSRLPRDVIWVKGNYQEKVPTDSNLYSGLKLVEDMIKVLKSKGVEFINATEGGAYIEGATLMSLREASKRYLKSKIQKGLLNVDRKPKFGDFIKRTQQIDNRLKEIVRLSTKAIDMDRDILKKWNRTHNIDEIRKQVDKVNQMNNEITFDEIFESAVANFFFRDFYVFNQEEIDIEGQDVKKRIEQSLKYFKLIKEKTSKTRKFIGELLEYLRLERDFYLNGDEFFRSFSRVVNLSELYYKFKNIFVGLDFVNKALEFYPENSILYYWKAKLCSLNRFMHREALENFQEALRLDPNFKKARFDYEVEKKMVTSHLILAKQAVEKKDFISAKKLINRALEYEPHNKEVKKWADTVNELAKASKDIQRQNVLFEQLKLEGDVFNEYKKAIEFVKKEDFDEAYEYLTKLYDKYGAFGDIPFLLGSILIDRNKLEDAEKYLKEAVELIPYQPLVYLALGKLYLMKEDYILAKENLERAISMNPDLKPGILDTLGNLYYEFAEYEKAFNAFIEYLNYSDDKIKTLTKLALCYKEMGMVQEYNNLMSKIKSMESAN